MAHQQGYLYRANGAWHLRHYLTRNGERIQRSRRICDGTFSKSEARTLAAPFIAELNTEDADRRVEILKGIDPDQTVAEFWTETYEPYILKHKRANTSHSYRAIWTKHLKAHFGARQLRSYQTAEATVFLTKLAETLGQRTVQHLRSLMSGIYSHAVAIGACKTNPIAGCKILGVVKEPGVTDCYSLEEAEDIMTALVDHVELQLIFALAFFAGLRPSEIGALRWDDLDDQYIHVRRAIGRGVVASTKTRRSQRAIPIIGPVRLPLEAWRRRCTGEGYVFGGCEARDLRKISERMVPILRERWRGLYAARRGFATELTYVTGDRGLAASQGLGHSDPQVTLDHYIKRVPEALVAAMKLLEAKTTKGTHDHPN
jgi:integrase